MNEELLIKRYQHRSGYRLADVKEVGLPVYSLNVQVLTLAHKRMPPIEEFILRALGLGMVSIEEVSRFLGLDREALKPGFANLAQTENVALTAQRGMQSWVLTQKGRSTLQTSEVVAPEESTFQIHFDAILRKPLLYRFQRPLRYRELIEEGLVEIEAYPPKRPLLSEISPGDIERIIKSIPSHTDQRRDVLVVRSIDNVKKGFLRAVALLFKGSEGKDVQLGFLVDGMLSREHELIFAQTEGFKRIVAKLEDGTPEYREVLETKESVAVSDSVEKAARDLNAAKIQAEVELAEEAEAVRLSTGEEEKEAVVKRLQEMQAKVDNLEREAQRLPVRDLYVADHAPLLQDALVNAKRRLLIISPWIKAKVVNREFVRRLEDLLRKGVLVYFGYGITEEETQDLLQVDRAAREDLRRLSEQYPNFRFVRLGDTHAKVLIKDSEFVAVTSFNWLSFKGDPRMEFRDEQGVLVQDPSWVDRKFEYLLSRFGPAEKRTEA